jgi:hypothetical protein
MQKKIICRLKGGQGNQMFQFALALLLSLKTKSDIFIDTTCLKNRFTRNTKRVLALNYFNIDFKKLDFFDKFFSFLIFFPGHKLFLSLFNYKIIDDKNFEYYINTINDSNSCNLILDGYFQDFSYLENIKEELNRRFSLNKHVAKKRVYISKNSAAIHIRRGDYVTNNTANKYHGVLPLSYYLEAIQKLEEYDKSLKFYIFTDDPDWVNANFHIYRAFKNISTLKLSSEEEFCLMKKCKHFIIANSTYSYWAAYLSESNNKIVIAPKNWNNVEIKIKFPKDWFLL